MRLTLRTLLAWLRMVNRERRDQAPAKFSPEESVGPLGDLLGMATEVREQGYCRMRLKVDEAWFNPNGVLHGGVVYTLIDYSMGGAVQAGLAEGEHCTSIEVKFVRRSCTSRRRRRRSIAPRTRIAMRAGEIGFAR